MNALDLCSAFTSGTTTRWIKRGLIGGPADVGGGEMRYAELLDHDRKTVQTPDGKFVVLTLRELLEVRHTDPHLLRCVDGEWCVPAWAFAR